MHENRGLRHDTSGGLRGWKVGCITKGEHIFVLVVLEGGMVHIHETIGSCYWLQEVRSVLRRDDMQEVIVHNDISISVLGVTEVGLTIILVNLVKITEEVRSDSLLLTDLI